MVTVPVKMITVPLKMIADGVKTLADDVRNHFYRGGKVFWLSDTATMRLQ